MNTTDWLAILGALAWLPPIIKWGKDYLTKADVLLITQPSAEVGFSTYGPIINIRLAFVVQNRDLVISGLRLRLQHEDGEARHFAWQGIAQRLGQMNVPQVGAVPFEKEHNVLAIKVNVKDVEERSVRFQETEFQNGKAALEAQVAKRFAHDLALGITDRNGVLNSQEMADLYAFIRQAFSWKAGRYTLTFDLQSPDSFDITNNQYQIFLTPSDIEALEKNRDLIQTAYREQFIPLQAPEVSKVVWNWRYPKLEPIVSRTEKVGKT